jgi:hypothetical protein
VNHKSRGKTEPERAEGGTGCGGIGGSLKLGAGGGVDLAGATTGWGEGIIAGDYDGVGDEEFKRTTHPEGEAGVHGWIGDKARIGWEDLPAVREDGGAIICPGGERVRRLRAGRTPRAGPGGRSFGGPGHMQT